MAVISELILKSKSLMPTKFITQVDDTRIEAFLNLVLADVNFTSPMTGYTLESMPSGWDWLIVFGSQVYSTLFLVGGYALSDFQYSDNGLSLSIDRQARLTPVYNAMLLNFGTMKLNLKKAIAVSTGAKVLGTFQYAHTIATWLNTIFPGTIQR